MKTPVIIMETITLKTNIKCNGCISAVKPGLDAIAELEKWEVDITTQDKVLTATGSGDQLESRIMEALEKSGYKAWK